MEALFAALLPSGQAERAKQRVSESFDFTIDRLSETFTVTVRGAGDGRKQAARIATVRRDVVRALVQEMIDRNHPAYRALLDKS
eukprot:gene12850-4610_t